jgi:hypothetical protein
VGGGGKESFWLGVHVRGITSIGICELRVTRCETFHTSAEVVDERKEALGLWLSLIGVVTSSPHTIVKLSRQNFALESCGATSLKDGLTRQLVVERENEIASNLAFLSATSDDNQKVMAVSVEEHPNGKDHNSNGIKQWRPLRIY